VSTLEKKLHTCPPSFLTADLFGGLAERDTEETQSDTEESFSLWNSLIVFSSVELCEIKQRVTEDKIRVPQRKD